MNRRGFLQKMLGLAGAASIPAAAQARTRSLLVQQSPVAGFQYHQGEDVWPHLREGAELNLVREPDNCHDPKAVRIDWQGHKIGYVPRMENHAIGQMLDRGEPLRARIALLQDTPDPWQRIRIEIHHTSARSQPS